jgi:hypothetical protein
MLSFLKILVKIKNHSILLTTKLLKVVTFFSKFVFQDMKAMYFTLFICLGMTNLFSQILAEEIRIGCGNKFFSENEHQHAMIVRGIWCGNSYFWTPINIGDSITEQAFYNDELFTGDCFDINADGLIIGKYTFEKGKISSLQHFREDGSLAEEFRYQEGIPNGVNTDYFYNGEIRLKRTYELGKLNGPFVEGIDLVDYGRGICTEEGVYANGQRKVISKPCDY